MSISAPSVYCRYLARLILHYYLKENLVDLPLRRAPKSSGDTDSLTVGDLEVEVPGRWVSLIPWLDRYAYAHQDTNHTGIDWQRSIGGQTFRFLDLPAEVRTIIFQQVIGRYIWPYKYSGFHLDSPKPRGTDNEHRTKFGQYWHDPIGARLPQDSAMPLVGWQVRNEFAEVFWGNTYKHFNSCDHFRSGAKVLDWWKFNYYRRISLGLTNADHFTTVGFIVFRTRLELRRVSSIWAITDNEDLEYLNLHFQVTPPDEQLVDPWAKFSPTDMSCQKTLVDWILTAALTQMKRVPKITISGHMKDSTRRKWEPILEDARKGIKHDMTAQMASILATPAAEL